MNEDNIETLVGSANIANPHTEGTEEEKVTFKDEKAEGAASKNLGKQVLTVLNAFVSNNDEFRNYNMKQILSKAFYFKIFLIISKHLCQHEKGCVNSQVYRPNEEKTKEEENERSEGGNCFP